MYYLVTWMDWKSNKEVSLRLSDKDVVRFVAILVNSIKPNNFTVVVTD